MQKITNKINNIIYKLIGKKNPLMASIVMNWENIIGSHLNKKYNIIPLKITKYFDRDKINKNILYIIVENHSIKTEIAFLKNLIIEKIAIYLGYKAIYDIKIIVNDNINNKIKNEITNE